MTIDSPLYCLTTTCALVRAVTFKLKFQTRIEIVIFLALLPRSFHSVLILTIACLDFTLNLFIYFYAIYLIFGSLGVSVVFQEY